LTFIGRNVTLLFAKSQYEGEIHVTIDGEVVGTINQTGDSEQWQQTWNYNGLTDSVHTITIVHTAGVFGNIDAISISNEPDTQVTPTNTTVPSATVIPTDANTQTPEPKYTATPGDVDQPTPPPDEQPGWRWRWFWRWFWRRFWDRRS
jgi:hypothetical protein